jgi:hypothetical protein
MVTGKIAADPKTGNDTSSLVYTFTPEERERLGRGETIEDITRSNFQPAVNIFTPEERERLARGETVEDITRSYFKPAINILSPEERERLDGGAGRLPDSIQSLNDYRFSEAAGWLPDDASAKDTDRIQTADDFARIAAAITGGDDRSAAETAAALSPRDAKLLADAVPAEKRALLNAEGAVEASDDDQSLFTDEEAAELAGESSGRKGSAAAAPEDDGEPLFTDEEVAEMTGESGGGGSPTVSPAAEDDDAGPFQLPRVDAEPLDDTDAPVAQDSPASDAPKPEDQPKKHPRPRGRPVYDEPAGDARTPDPRRRGRPVYDEPADSAAKDPKADQPAPSDKPEDKDEQAKRHAAYEKRYPREDREGAAKALRQAIPNWDKLDIDTRSALTHLAIDAGVENIVANKALIAAANNNNHAGIIHALKQSDDLLPADDMDDYVEGFRTLGPPMELRSHIPPATPRDLQAADLTLQKGYDTEDSKWVHVDNNARNVVARLAKCIGTDKVLANEALMTALRNGDYDAATAAMAQFGSALPANELTGYIDGMRSVARYVAQQRERLPEGDYKYKPGYARPGENPEGVDDSDVVRPGARKPIRPPAPGEEPSYETKLDIDRIATELEDPSEEGFAPKAVKVDDRLTIGYGIDLEHEGAVKKILMDLGIDEEKADELYRGWVAGKPIDRALADKYLRRYVERSITDVRNWLGTDEHGRSIYNLLPGRTKEVILKLRYQVGIGGLKRFKEMRKALRTFDLDAAGWEIWDSKDGRRYVYSEATGGLPKRRRKHAKEMQEVTDVMYGKPESEIGKGD